MKIRLPLKITSRTSTITNSFVQAIIPVVQPSADEYHAALDILGMTHDNLSCVYCGSPTTDWDHFRPLVRDKRPTGYVNEIRNLVPSCGPCNQSKGGRHWREWMTSSARGSPRTRAISDLQQRVERLAAFETWGNVQPLSLEQFVSEKDWNEHWSNLAKIQEMMTEAQTHAEKVRHAIRTALQPTQPAAAEPIETAQPFDRT